MFYIDVLSKLILVSAKNKKRVTEKLNENDAVMVLELISAIFFFSNLNHDPAQNQNPIPIIFSGSF